MSCEVIEEFENGFTIIPSAENQPVEENRASLLFFFWTVFIFSLSKLRSLPPGRKTLRRQAHVFVHQVSTVRQLR